MSAKPDPNLEYYSRLRERAITYLEKWIGHFCLWSGDDPSGFDCSGLIVEVLQAVGIIWAILLTGGFIFTGFKPDASFAVFAGWLTGGLTAYTGKRLFQKKKEFNGGQ